MCISNYYHAAMSMLPAIDMRAEASSLWYKMCTQDFLTNMVEHIVEEKKILRFVNTGFRVTH